MISFEPERTPEISLLPHFPSFLLPPANCPLYLLVAEGQQHCRRREPCRSPRCKSPSICGEFEPGALTAFSKHRDQRHASNRWEPREMQR